MGKIEFKQKSMLTTVCNDGLILRIIKEHAEQIKELGLQGRRLDVTISIRY